MMPATHLKFDHTNSITTFPSVTRTPGSILGGGAVLCCHARPRGPQGRHAPSETICCLFLHNFASAGEIVVRAIVLCVSAYNTAKRRETSCRVFRRQLTTQKGYHRIETFEPMTTTAPDAETSEQTPLAPDFGDVPQKRKRWYFVRISPLLSSLVQYRI